MSETDRFLRFFRVVFFQREAKRDFNQEFKWEIFSQREINLINYAIEPVDEFFFLLEVNKSEMIANHGS